MLGARMLGEYRLLTPTTPLELKDALNIALSKILKRMRWHILNREYIVVKEWLDIPNDAVLVKRCSR